MNTQASKSAPDYIKLMNDPKFRQRLRQQDQEALKVIGLEPQPEAGEMPQLKVVTSTRGTTYIAMHTAPTGGQFSYEELREIQAAGGTAGSAGSAGSVGSVMCACSTASTVGSVATASTAASH